MQDRTLGSRGQGREKKKKKVSANENTTAQHNKWKGKFHVLILLSKLLGYYVRCIFYLSRHQISTSASED